VDTKFEICVEVVPPAGPEAGTLLTALQAVSSLPFERFSVATNPVARARMSALALSGLIQQRTGKPATLHCTTRDHNRLSIQGLLWGARALGIDTVLVATGDYVALGERVRTTTVRDVDIYDLVAMAREAGLRTGVVLDPRPETHGLEHQVHRLERKVQAGAQFAATQPVFDRAGASALRDATRHLEIPVMLGILPLRSARHARFLHQKVSGIRVPQHVQDRMSDSADAVAEGTAGARQMLDIARQWFAGACLMPPFDHYELLRDILSE
jgi:homocysteine S-methyltransferase